MIQPLALLKPSQTRNMLQILEMLVPASTPIETRGHHQTRLLTLWIKEESTQNTILMLKVDPPKLRLRILYKSIPLPNPWMTAFKWDQMETSWGNSRSLSIPTTTKIAYKLAMIHNLLSTKTNSSPFTFNLAPIITFPWTWTPQGIERGILNPVLQMMISFILLAKALECNKFSRCPRMLR